MSKAWYGEQVAYEYGPSQFTWWENCEGGRAAGHKAGARWCVCPGKQYGLDLLGQQRILKYLRRKLGGVF
jgi:hypothetical protein